MRQVIQRAVRRLTPVRQQRKQDNAELLERSNQYNHFMKTKKEEMGPLPDYRQYRLTRAEGRRYYLVGGLAAAAMGFLFYHSIVLLLLAPLLTFPLKRYYEQHLAAKRRMELSVQFKDLLASLSASFATGRQMTEALQEAWENLKLIYNEDAPICRELSLMINRLTKGLEGERTVLFDFADRSACEDIAGFTDVYFTCLTTGGDRGRAVRRASDLIMDKIDIRREILTLTAQKKFEARILAGLPPLILAFLSATSPDYLNVLYTTPVGRLIMTAALATLGISFLWSVRITDIEV